MVNRLKQLAVRIAPGLAHTYLRTRDLRVGRPFVRGTAAWVGGTLDGMNVLEVGSDAVGRNLLAASELGARHVVGVNPVHSSAALATNIELLQEDAGYLSAESDYFDFVISDSTFEHVHDVPGVLAELARVTRPGGLFYAHYGPIWSTAYGHHLWLSHRGRRLSYHEIELPGWCHLIDSPDQVRQHVQEGLSLDCALTDAVVEWVFSSDEQNRLLFDDYFRMIDQSSWDVIWMKGYDYPELRHRYLAQPDVRERLRRVEERWPDRSGWLFDGITMLLEA